MFTEAEMNERLIHFMGEHERQTPEKVKFELDVVEWVEIQRQREVEKAPQCMSKRSDVNIFVFFENDAG